MNKKAQIQLLMWFMNILLVSIIIITLLYSVNKINKGTYYEEKVISKDIASFYDAVAASPYKTEVTYKINDELNLKLDIDENCFVKVFNPSSTLSRSYCGIDTYSPINCKTQNNCFITNNIISIKNG